MGIGQMAGSGSLSPEEIARQQERWEKERVESDKKTYQGHVAHMALLLMNGANGAAYTHETALHTAHLLLQGAKTYSP